MSTADSTDNLRFADIKGETLIKNPGSINGESFSLRDLTDCSVYILDYTSEVDITNCTNCQIFVGPVDGPAILDSCSNCNVAVSCQQFQAKNCTTVAVGLYCATVPTMTGCSDINISCWNGSYAGLSSHFAAANLDPTKNQWNKVYDASAVSDQSPNFTLIETAAEPWEVVVEGATGPPENPVPAPVVVAAVAAVSAAAAAPLLDEDVFPIMENGNTDPNGGLSNQNTAAAAAGLAVDVLTPSTAAAQSQLQDRLKSQAREEAEKKAAAQAAAAHYLEEFYQQRNAAKATRIAAGRDELARRGSGEAAPEGESVWEKAISMIDFNASRPGGSDLSRFKSVMFACKQGK